jgi:hypothetical protein
MSQRTLDIATGQFGGVQQLCRTSRQPRSIHVTVYNLDTTAAHAAFFGRSRRELGQGPSNIQLGFCVGVSPAVAPAAGNGVNFDAGAGVIVETGIQGPALVAFTSMVFQGWAGELWAVADATGKVIVDVFDSAVTEE